MIDWELVYVDKSRCDECQQLLTCNIYRTPFGCTCYKCVDMGRVRYRYRHICGLCLNKWLKSSYGEVDYGD